MATAASGMNGGPGPLRGGCAPKEAGVEDASNGARVDVLMKISGHSPPDSEAGRPGGSAATNRPPRPRRPASRIRSFRQARRAQPERPKPGDFTSASEASDGGG